MCTALMQKGPCKTLSTAQGRVGTRQGRIQWDPRLIQRSNLTINLFLHHENFG
jgi:hypothetical protein